MTRPNRTVRRHIRRFWLLRAEAWLARDHRVVRVCTQIIDTLRKVR